MGYSEIIAWVLLTLTLIIAYNRTLKVDEFSIIINNLEEELDNTIKTFKEQKEYLIEEAKKWELMATAPMEPPSEFIITTAGDIERLCFRSEIFPGGNYDQIAKATDDMLNAIKPYIYTELTQIREGGLKEYYQEIFIGTPKRIHHEKRY